MGERRYIKKLVLLFLIFWALIFVGISLDSRVQIQILFKVDLEKPTHGSLEWKVHGAPALAGTERAWFAVSPGVNWVHLEVPAVASEVRVTPSFSAAQIQIISIQFESLYGFKLHQWDQGRFAGWTLQGPDRAGELTGDSFSTPGGSTVLEAKVGEVISAYWIHDLWISCAVALLGLPALYLFFSRKKSVA